MKILVFSCRVAAHAFEMAGLLQRALEPLGASYNDVVYSTIYALTKGVADKTGIIAAEFLPHDRHIPETSLMLEGLPSLDASMAVEVIAALKR